MGTRDTPYRSEENYVIISNKKEIVMALAVDKDGKIIEKHLTLNEDTIRASISKAKKNNHKKVLQEASQIKFNRRTI
jgi:hypothetical protein